jgi:broad specificity phosphatase PhoE/predicted kinase
MLLMLVGLPARGKTFIGRKLARYLSWLGYRTRVFNVGSYRRERLGSYQPHSFFSPDNLRGEEARRRLAELALEDALGWFSGVGDVAIYDATNTTRERRDFVRHRAEREGIKVLCIETICDDEAIIEQNIRETKLTSPDYLGIDPEQAVRDFRARIDHYARVYEPVGEDEGAYIKVVNVGRQVVTHRLQGYLPGRLVFFLMNLHIVPRPLWLTRHGESLYNLEGRIGGDAELSPRGERYAQALTGWMHDHATGEYGVWTSTLRRAAQTARHLPVPAVAWRALDEIDAGVCDGMTYEQVREELPQEFEARQRDKLRFRYPRGESYEDVIQRLEPVIIELERQQNPVLVVTHRAVLRALYAYFMDRPPEDCTRLDIPLHTVLELTPRAYGCEERLHPIAV